MTLPDEVRRGIEALSREVALVCDATGTIVWADARAAAVLGAGVGQPLAALAAAGSAEPAARLAVAAGVAPVQGWALVLRARGEPRAFVFEGAPVAAGALLVGHETSDDHGALLAKLSAALGELATLQRESERQRDAIARLERAAAEQARLEEMRLTTRELAHLLNNDLAAAIGLVDLLHDGGTVPAELRPLLRDALTALERAEAHVRQLQRVVRAAPASDAP
jgi:signal transduction histidine kinase